VWHKIGRGKEILYYDFVYKDGYKDKNEQKKFCKTRKIPKFGHKNRVIILKYICWSDKKNPKKNIRTWRYGESGNIGKLFRILF